MALTIILNLGLVIGSFLFLRKKYEMKLVPILVGAVAFILFAMVLEQMLHSVVLGGNSAIHNNPWLMVLYGALAAGVFEETARFISFKLLKKKYSGLGTGLSYGIGHGDIEVVLLVVLANINNIIYSFMINAGNAATLGSSPQGLQIVQALTSTASPMFLVSFVERIPAFAVHVSLSVLVWYAATRKGKLWLYPLAIGLHALMDVAPAMAQSGIIQNLTMTLALIYISSAAIVTIVLFAHKRLSAGSINAAAQGITGGL